MKYSITVYFKSGEIITFSGPDYQAAFSLIRKTRFADKKALKIVYTANRYYI
jgi:hypothetical protein